MSVREERSPRRGGRGEDGPCDLTDRRARGRGVLSEALAGDVSTTMMYTHVLNRGGRGERSPLDGVLHW